MKLHRLRPLLPLALLAITACDDPASSSADASLPAPGADAASDRPDAADPAAPDAMLSPDATPLPDATPQADADPANDGIPQGPNIVTMVAPSVCRTINGHLRSCQFGPVTLQAPASPGPGQYKTRVLGHHQGDCSTQFPFVARLSADGVEPFTYHLFLNEQAILRRDDSAALASVLVENGSSFPGSGNYGLDCRVWLEVDFNVPIVVTPQP